VLFLGDGMGVTTVTAARIREGQLRGEPGEENWLAFERFPHTALAKTYNTDSQVPDSAGTMTAIATGAKTRAGHLSVDEEVTPGDAAGVPGHELETLLERAEARGLATGVVTTTRITHATPAACYAHSPNRDWEDDSQLPESARAAGFPDLARQLVEFARGDGLEVALGGGRAQFLPREAKDPEHAGQTGARLDRRDLSAEWVARRPRSAYVWNRAQLESLDLPATDHLLGLFEPGHLSFEADRARDPAGEPSLSEMTAAALAILSRSPRGFFLMVEGGRIDHAHHAGNAYRALGEAIELSNAVRVALERTDPEETLILVTADHSHVLTFAGYPTRGNDILGLVVPNDERGEPAREPARDALGLPYATLGYQNGPGYPGASGEQPEGAKRFPHRASGARPAGGRPDLSRVETRDPGFLQEAAVPLASETHGGEDVPVYATGPGSELVRGVREQSYLYHVLARALGLD
jgi:alkaline phosphatase